MKVCNKCKNRTSLKEFHVDNSSKDGRKSWCKRCSRESALRWRNENILRARATASKWYKENPDKANEKSSNWYYANKRTFRNAFLKRTHNITLFEWEKLFDGQDRKCAICRTNKPGKPPFNSWATDHDRKCCSKEKSCGKCIRGILCARCNKGIGLLQDNEIFLGNAILYLRKNKERNAQH